MSYLTPLSSIELSLEQTEQEQKRDQKVSSLDIKKLPRWLLEFDSFSVNETKFKNNGNTRPMTESSVTKRPQWFSDMSQPRRSSDAFASSDNRSDLFPINTRKLDKHSSSSSARRRSQRTAFTEGINEEDNQLDTFLSIPKQIDHKQDISYPTKHLKNGFKSCENLFFELNQSLNEDPNDFIIPELPFGQNLVIEIISNWGDEDFVGLNGIEVLDPNGTDLRISKIWSQSTTDCPLDSLIDGIYRTHDDSHLWSTQLGLNRGLPLKICINFERKTSIALIRIWNYNKSRIYSDRGIKFIEIELDNSLIFKGEIAKASGNLIAPIEAFGDTILFTTDEEILESVAQRDHSFQELVNDIIPLTQ